MIFFFQRRGLKHANLFRSSTESGFIDHWANRVYIAEPTGSRDTLSNNDTEDEAIANTGRLRSPSWDSSQKRNKSGAIVEDLVTVKNTLANRRVAQISAPYTNGSTAPTKAVMDCAINLTPLTAEVMEKYKVKAEPQPQAVVKKEPMVDDKPLISFEEIVVPAKIPKSAPTHGVATRSKSTSSASAMVTDLLGNWSPTGGSEINPAGPGRSICSTPNSGATPMANERTASRSYQHSDRRASQRIKTRSKVETDF